MEGDADEVESSQLSLAEAERIIARLEEVVREQHVVLVGGQAVSICSTNGETQSSGMS